MREKEGSSGSERQSSGRDSGWILGYAEEPAVHGMVPDARRRGHIESGHITPIKYKSIHNTSYDRLKWKVQ